MTVLLPRVADVVFVIAGGGGRLKGAGDRAGDPSCVCVEGLMQTGRGFANSSFMLGDVTLRADAPITGGVSHHVFQVLSGEQLF